MPFSSLVRANFETGSCVIFEHGSRHFQACFLTLFEPASCHFRAQFEHSSSTLRCSRPISFAEGSEGPNKASALEATSQFTPISSFSGSEIHVGSNWL